MIYLGADPGMHGGLASLTEHGDISVVPMPLRGGEICTHELGAWLWGFVIEHAKDVILAVEKVGAMPKQGVVSTFTFGVGYGKLLGAAGALGIRTELVTPQAWKKVVLAGTAKDKDAAVAYCQRAFPAARLIPQGCRVPHDGMADALCIAEFARRTYR